MGLRYAWVVALLVGSCMASPRVVDQAYRDMDAGRLDEAVKSMERQVAEYPDYAAARNTLGWAYYLRARQALDEERYDDYERDLAWATDQLIESLRIDPESAQPHTSMGIVSAYQGNLNAALLNFRNALRLDPRSSVHYTNLAQTLIYRGQVAQARRWLRKAQRLPSNPAILDLDYAFAAWREGDLVEAEDLFNSAYRYSPDHVNIWDGARITEHIDSFEAWAGYCCSSPACGPYMEVQCKEMQLGVAHRRVRAETLRKELVIEMERRRKLNEIYNDRKDLKIEVEEPK